VGLFENNETWIKWLLYSDFVFKTQNWQFSDYQMFLQTGRRSSSQQVFAKSKFSKPRIDSSLIQKNVPKNQ